jgi:hypothetical protein
MQKMSLIRKELREKRFAIMLPEEVVAGFGWAEGEVPARVREILDMELLRRHAISRWKAAELLQLNLQDLFQVNRKISHDARRLDKPVGGLTTPVFETRVRYCLGSVSLLF